MRPGDIKAVRKAMEPSAADGRLARLGKLAALALIDLDRPVTRSTLSQASKTIDDDEDRAKRGFSEASLRTNPSLRAVYETARDHVPTSPVRRRGSVGAHILRMTKPQIAGALVIARLAAQEREEERRLALGRLAEARDSRAINALKKERDRLPANRTSAHLAPVAAQRKTAIAVAHVEAITRARKWAAGRSIRPTAEWLADHCGIHPGTVERLAAHTAATAATADVLGFDLPLPPSLMRYRKWDLGRALHVERAYIRALHAETIAIATIVIDLEHQKLRKAARDAT